MSSSCLAFHITKVFDQDGHNVEAVHRSPETRAKWTWLEIGRV